MDEINKPELLATLCMLILVNIMFHAPKGRFQLEFIFITYFSTVVPFNNRVFISCRPFVFINKTCWEYYDNNKRTTGKKNTTIVWDDGGKIGNKNKYPDIICYLWHSPLRPKSTLQRALISHSVVFLFPVGLSLLSQQLQHPTKPVEKGAITTIDLQERKKKLLNGTMVEK